MAAPVTSSQPPHGAGDEPGCLAAELAVEQPAEAGGAPLAAVAATAATAAHAAGLVAREATEAVVAEDQVEDAVVLGPADVGP
jgi:hypothetical protein